MSTLDFERHDSGRIELDFCFPCQVIWFDTMESQQLAPRGVIEVFTALNDHRVEARNSLPTTFVSAMQREAFPDSRCPAHYPLHLPPLLFRARSPDAFLPVPAGEELRPPDHRSGACGAQSQGEDRAVLELRRAARSRARQRMQVLRFADLDPRPGRRNQDRAGARSGGPAG